MTQTRPRLVTFGISHFCEKARWALDWHGIDFEEVSWSPGVHQILAKRHGAECTTLPILFDGTTLIQGSNRIIDWADAQTRDQNRRLTHSDAVVIERRADNTIGPLVRRLAYAHTLPKRAHVVKPALFNNTSPANRMVGNMMWPVTVMLMRKKFEITPTAGSESRSQLDDELDWLDGLLGDGRQYLAGNRLSRADITVASLLAHIARPPAHDRFCQIPLIDEIASDCERWRDRPTMRWVQAQYRDNRPVGQHAAA